MLLICYILSYVPSFMCYTIFPYVIFPSMYYSYNLPFCGCAFFSFYPLSFYVSFNLSFVAMLLRPIITNDLDKLVINSFFLSDMFSFTFLLHLYCFFPFYLKLFFHYDLLRLFVLLVLRLRLIM